MLGLLPRDQWEYDIADLWRGLYIALGFGRQGESLVVPGLGNCIPVRSGRAAIVTALKALNLSSGARIGVPLYCCPVVFRAIVLAGCVPRFIDVDDVTFCMSAEDLSAKRGELDAVIVVHTLGNMCDMPRLQAAAPNTPFIEDCAQSLGSTLAGKMAGSFGNVSVFSFRSGKYLSVGEGGGLFSNSEVVRSRAADFIAALRSATRVEELRHVVTTYLKSLLRRKPLYGMIGYRLWAYANKKFRLSAKSDIVLGQIYRTDLALTAARLPLLRSAIEARRVIADSYLHNLVLGSKMLCSEPPNTFYNRIHFPIIFPSRSARDAVAAHLLEKGIDSIKYLEDIIEIATKVYGYTGSCPISEQLSERVLLIPNYCSLHEKDIERITECVNAKWAEVSSNGSQAPSPICIPSSGAIYKGVRRHEEAASSEDRRAVKVPEKGL